MITIDIACVSPEIPVTEPTYIMVARENLVIVNGAPLFPKYPTKLAESITPEAKQHSALKLPETESTRASVARST
jgi:hypothetical protein